MSVPIASPGKGEAFDGRGADTAVYQKKRQKKPTMYDRYQKSYRLGRRPGEQGPCPLSRNQDRVEKSVTGTTTITTNTATGTATSPSTATIMETTRKAPTASTTTAAATVSTASTATSATTVTKCDTQTLKMTKDIFTVGTWNVHGQLGSSNC
ncbi:unnamed protein product [Didymodactylos carnosus]|uniref:Uncharacterized protein n=1 Tax=Didymodactylos carnosus TaxID=1234261 RepID=A0A8S2H5B7_9BILA|nr:unnamed protein product [Didymodactylos carnosus]CAF3601015.1 unnamed protein product [Didymodactylos carnosus]